MAKKGGYGFGIVGCGMIADFHARALEATRGGHLTCVFSRSKANADRVAKKFDCASYQNYKAFLAHPGLDIVAIATPSGAHLEPCVQAAKAGKHIICEKPLEVTLNPYRANQIINQVIMEKVGQIQKENPQFLAKLQAASTIPLERVLEPSVRRAFPNC